MRSRAQRWLFLQHLDLFVFDCCFVLSVVVACLVLFNIVGEKKSYESKITIFFLSSLLALL